MRRHVWGALMLFGVVACSSGGEDTGLTANQQAIVDCSRLTVTDVVRIVAQVERLLVGEVPLTPSVGNEFLYALEFDGSTMTGAITFPQDPANGIPLGQDILLTLNLTGPFEGSGDLTFRFSSASRATMHGGLNLRNVLGCSSNLAFSPTRPFNVEFRSAIAGPAPAAEILKFSVWGVIDSVISAFDRTQFVGALDIAESSQAARLSGALDGTDFVLVFSLFPNAQQQQELADCFGATDELRRELFRILEQLTNAIHAGGADLTTLPEIPGLTLTANSASNATYVLDATEFETILTAGTIRGGVRLTRVNFETTAFWSWRISGEIREEIGGEISEDRVFGRSARFFEIAVGDAGTNRVIGDGTLGRGDCAGSFEEDSTNFPATRTVRTEIGAHSLAIDYENNLPVVARIDGIPVPLSSVLPLLRPLG